MSFFESVFNRMDPLPFILLCFANDIATKKELCKLAENLNLGNVIIYF